MKTSHTLAVRFDFLNLKMQENHIYNKKKKNIHKILLNKNLSQNMYIQHQNVLDVF